MSFVEEFTPKHLTLIVESPTFWRVTFDNPPINVIGLEMMRDLKALLTELEHNDTVNVVVFDSADPDFYIAHYDVAVDNDAAEALPSPTGYTAWVDITVRMSKLNAVTIAAIRGITRGAGSELVLAMDMRFASLEKARLAQVEIALMAVTGGGASGRLPSLVGRGRAMEILLGGEDFDGALAEKYGYVNRAVPDLDFDEFVNAFARRVSGWDHRAIVEVKAFIDKYTRLPDAEYPLHSDAYWAAVARPEVGEIVERLLKQGMQTRGSLEYNLGEGIAAVAQDRS
ncbi:enoyl-CoA hydratase/isomerase family protein [Rhodococcus fascians]|nr:enoyl-CoA hydratase/isomerase family protein [Rhodococcus fascians]MBY3998495.1 enoyl-CoA hydratase/isomerase family protein [Rhodococcus fascians]MBY4004511.1 enoyl-CoA hydratase/isomerase family protein [Rhodococcus fascians]MBY4009308.1 enoyl-CoA hydratase/isomerase family protein [Rhodococcus fascians]MBY4019718.1 enoyl-CoA hydratase/isomerase family protein [Rhodococcus fascians]